MCQHEDSRVLHTDAFDEQINRRRECSQCRHRWQSIELPAEQVKRFDELMKALKPVRELLR